jgi:hypothetical protein
VGWACNLVIEGSPNLVEVIFRLTVWGTLGGRNGEAYKIEETADMS